ncbi:MAG: hypothetical protein IJ523_07960 [Succinivibrionaceae bacterium]|nr:hypothetical protein [Succinivibrionaceae bacterium]
MNNNLFMKLAEKIVADYVIRHLDKSDPAASFSVFIVWMCKTLGNNKALLSTTLHDGMYYELTYNGEKKEFYLDAYKKFENQVIHYEDVSQ